MKKLRNFAFIDGQNFHLGMEYKIDFERFRIYLHDKFHIKYAYYFLGVLKPQYQSLYSKLQEAGFVLIFREHLEQQATNKKGNVDTDIVFEMMKSLIERDVDKLLLVSGDGDFKKVVDYLIEKDKFLKILFPNQKKASSLYKKLGDKYFINLNQSHIRLKFEHKKRRG